MKTLSMFVITLTLACASYWCARMCSELQDDCMMELWLFSASAITGIFSVAGAVGWAMMFFEYEP